MCIKELSIKTVFLDCFTWSSIRLIWSTGAGRKISGGTQLRSGWNTRPNVGCSSHSPLPSSISFRYRGAENNFNKSKFNNFVSSWGFQTVSGPQNILDRINLNFLIRTIMHWACLSNQMQTDNWSTTSKFGSWKLAIFFLIKYYNIKFKRMI